MNARNLVLFCLISGLAAAAQTAPPSQKVAPGTAKAAVTPATSTAKPAPLPGATAKPAAAAKPKAKATATAAKPAATTAKPAAKPASATAKPTANPMKPNIVAQKPVAQKPIAEKPAQKAIAQKSAQKPVAKKPVQKPVAQKKTVEKPVKAAVKVPDTQAANTRGKRDPFISPVREGAAKGGPDCAIGKKCLAIDAILLRGVVRAPSGSIAVVESSTRRTTYFLRENDPVFNGFVVKITGDSVMFRENVMDRFGRQNSRDIVKRLSTPPV